MVFNTHNLIIISLIASLVFSHILIIKDLNLEKKVKFKLLIEMFLLSIVIHLLLNSSIVNSNSIPIDNVITQPDLRENPNLPETPKTPLEKPDFRSDESTTA